MKKTPSHSVKKPTVRKSPSLRSQGPPRTLCVDVGGSGIKASVLDHSGAMLAERVRVETPLPCPPQSLLEAIDTLVSQLPSFDRVSVGFPGVVKAGKVLTAVNLERDAWPGFDLATALEERLKSRVRVLNDADMQGLGAIEGCGVEFVMTLGTGVGTSLFWDGRLAPHLEIAHHPLWDGRTYEECLGNTARKKVGDKKWNRRVQSVIPILRKLIHFDRLHLGGGNAKKLSFELDQDTRIVSNQMGIVGGVAVWSEQSGYR